MKTVSDVRRLTDLRLGQTWAAELDGQPAWPHAFALSAPTGRRLQEQFPQVRSDAAELHEWARRHRLSVTDSVRLVAGTRQTIPTHVTVPDLEAAVSVAGGDWAARMSRGRERLRLLRGSFPDAREWVPIVRALDGYSNTDFALLCDVTSWFASNNAAGLTPRQVPVPGVHAKWLNTHQREIRRLLDREDLGLAPPHPARVYFTYLDPVHLASRGRRHDSATVGDKGGPAYVPTTVLISENKDTAVNFPPLVGGIVVEGVGRGGGTIAQFHWITGAPLLLYWGDIDTAGFEILDEFRRSGVPATSILMDSTTLDRYGDFGTRLDPRGNEISSRASRKPLDHLTIDERDVYRTITHPDWQGPRRLEQERIPLSVALNEVTARAGGSPARRWG